MSGNENENTQAAYLGVSEPTIRSKPIMTDRLTRHNGIPEHHRFCDCLDCRAAWEEWHEAKYRQRQLDRDALADIELRQAKPATDAEWAAFMDAEYPRVGATS
jgi:hypothetical protein